MPSPPGPPPPLPTLLSQALVAFTIEFDNLAEERITAAGVRPWMVSHAMWANHHPLVLHRGGFPDGA